jgi:hypothetical protein
MRSVTGVLAAWVSLTGPEMMKREIPVRSCMIAVRTQHGREPLAQVDLNKCALRRKLNRKDDWPSRKCACRSETAGLLA